MSNRTRAHRPVGLGYVIDDIRKEASHLTNWQLAAAQLLMVHMNGQASGNSAGMVGQMSDKVDCSRVARTYPPGVGGVALTETISRQLRGLRQHEIDLLSKIAFGRGRCLEDYGRVRSSFKANRTARAFAIGRVTALLDSVAELAELKPLAG